MVVPANKQCVKSNCKSATHLADACTEVFFSRNVLRVSNLKGGGTLYKGLNKDIVGAIHGLQLFDCFFFNSAISLGFVLQQYPETKLSMINQVMNNKCTAARRGVKRAAPIED